MGGVDTTGLFLRRLHHRVAATDAEGLAGNKTGGVGSQEHDRIGDLLGFPHAAQDIGPLDPLQDILGEYVLHLVPHAVRTDFFLVRGYDQAGADHI